MKPQIAVVLLVACVACEDGSASQQEMSVKPGAIPFVLPETAENARVISQGEGAVQYDLREAYPAERALATIENSLKSSGWIPLTQDLWNPGLPSSNTVGWRNFIDGTVTPKLRVYQWLGYWRNGAGDVVMYGLRYKASDAARGASPAGDGTAVIEIFTAPALARAKIKVPL